MSERVVNGIHELTEDVSGSPYWNQDIAPTNTAQRKWGTRDIAALWVGMSVCNPTYMLAGGLIDQGMNWWQALLTIFLGNFVVLVPMILNAVPGTKYGIPFPVYCRASFGVVGSNLPAMLRAVVACGWFGIQTWIGGSATYVLVKNVVPALATWPALPGWLGINAGQLACFLLFWLVNMIIIYRGMESIRWMEDLSAPFLILLGVGLLLWAGTKTNWFADLLAREAKGDFWTLFPAQLTAMVGFWATLSLNIPDFSRFARSQKDQVLGQTLGLPTTMTLYSFVGVAVTSAALVIPDLAVFRADELRDPGTLVVRLREGKDPVAAFLREGLAPESRQTLDAYAAGTEVSPQLRELLVVELNKVVNGETFFKSERFEAQNLSDKRKAAISGKPTGVDRMRLHRELLEDSFPESIDRQNLWDPVTICGRFDNPLVVAFAILALWIATLTTNLAANVVSPANDISNLAPRLISFRTGGMITGFAGILMMPWKLIQDTQGYIFTWLIGYGALLGPVGGILIADFFILRGMRLRLADLYKGDGAYRHQGGWNERAVLSLLIGIVPNIPGFLVASFPGRFAASPFFCDLYQYAWFVGFGISFLSYVLLMAVGALEGPAERAEA
ncbi:MAG: NCS1 family nucleobase:cation symporter-1 [Planctomycetes bacterium]|nr:NCS1 family nucleobase:cation symporter-1 [Planctomycetota bacterium]